MRFITGQGRYVDDLKLHRPWRAVFVRSPHAHARILRVDVAEALRAPGVIAVFRGSDLLDSGVGSIPCAWFLRSKDGSPMVEPPRYPLAVDKVRHVGDPLAVVIAETALQARDAAECIVVDYEELPAVTRGVDAMKDHAPLVWEQAAGNICCDWEIGDSTAVEAAFARAAHVTRIGLTNNRLVANPMEPRTAVASYDAGSDAFVLYTTSQNPHQVRSVLCNSVLKIPETRLRVVSPDVGGGFGTKASIYPEEAVLAWAARALRGTVRWTNDRSEGFLTDVQGRDHETCAELALDENGVFIGLRVRTIANVGAYLSSGSTAIPTYYYAPLLSGPYRTHAIYCNVTVCFSNTTSVDAYRGAGRPEATYVLERLIEKAAREMAIDRVELRRRNFIRAEEFPYKTPLGLEYDSGDHEKTLELALEAADWSGFEARREASRQRGMLRGIGLSTYVEIAGGTPSKMVGLVGGRGGRSEAAQIRIHPSGDVTVFSGTHSHGQGHETTYAQIVAERLGVPLDGIKIVQGDTDQLPYGRGTIASRSLVVGGSAIVAGLDKIVSKASKIAAHLLEAAPDDVEFEAGEFRVSGTDRIRTFKDVARAAYQLHDYPIDALEPGLDETAFYDPKNWTFPGGCHVCELEIDPETGVVTIERIIAADDVGRVINPMIVEGQIHGGLAQGVGQAIFESCAFDESGQPLTGSFMDYAMPRASDMPNFTVLTHGTDCNHNPLKAKGCAEVGSVGVPPAIINALLDALHEKGVDSLEMPATPFAIWKALNQAEASHSARNNRAPLDSKQNQSSEKG
ncbi:xanthine dehydrogenase family protein molybdopterin-binding subunit [Mesorhizobium sp. 1B3]|uniref:xanthine dehydrogenase family protein molybdopterin-binding subunit n=1 Tax=Mesorhizobium sp. 1B3 TaxID=3243599 RepID=UPI003D955199